MISKLIAWLAGYIILAISTLGYGGVVLLMAIESACIPLPSEIIMPFSGYLVFKGELDLFWVAFAGAAGCVVGSVPAYYLGAIGGRPLIEKYGHWVLISRADLDLADRLFTRYGQIVILAARMLPVVRTFIAFPAGVARMPMPRFLAYTFVGSFPFCLFLAWVGARLGENWNTLGPYFHQADVFIVLAGAAGAAWWIRRHLRNRV